MTTLERADTPTGKRNPLLQLGGGGLSLSLTEILTGAILGKNGYGEEAYSICPAQGQGETYVFTLYALPQALSPKRDLTR